MSVAMILPSLLGKYEVLLRLGSGGMASVYLARTRGPGGFERLVALKVLHPHLLEEAEGRRVILEEGRIAARIRHGNVVAVTDVGESDQGIYLVMDYVEGATLSTLHRQVMDRGERIPVPIALRIVVDMLAGLHAAHETRSAEGAPLGLVHRDVSPQNVLVGADGVVRLTDFGIAKVIGSAGVTLSDQIKGKPAYMAPEQARARPIDRRADVWAAGVVAWELLTGKRMFPVGDNVATLLQVVAEPRPRLRSVDATIDAAIDDAVAQALERDPARRLATAEAFRAALLQQKWVPLADAREVAEYVAAELCDALAAPREALEAQRRPVRDALASLLQPVEGTELMVHVDERSVGGVTSPSGRQGRVQRRWVAVVVGTAVVGLGALAVLRTRGHEATASDTSPPGTASAASPSASTPVAFRPVRSESPPLAPPSVAASAAPKSTHVPLRPAGSRLPAAPPLSAASAAPVASVVATTSAKAPALLPDTLGEH
ncbi:MAG: serine/threonine protein kinase [Polyangiaceae bacterium]|nr:serine/threonine protein kinase [Polyangiaceae bacterium]